MQRKTESTNRKKGKDKAKEKVKRYGKFNQKSIRIEQKKKDASEKKQKK